MSGELYETVHNYLANETLNRVYRSENSDVRYYLQGYQFTDTESHPEWRLVRKGEYHGDIGGPFYTKKYHSSYKIENEGISGIYRVDPDPIVWTDGRQRFQHVYNGPVLPCAPNYLNWPNLDASSNDLLDELGATAIARCSPSNPSVDLAVAFGELFKEGIPRLIGSTLRTWKGMSNRERRKAIADEHLNYEFGWKPMLKDLADFANTMLDYNDVFKRYVAGSGSMIRRSYSFPEVKSTETRTLFTGVSPWISPSSGVLSNPASPGGTVYRTDEVTVRRWFRGAFSYYVPPPDGLRNEIARAIIMARKTLGISLTPDTLWNLAPWSWAVDWFSNTGDVLSNWTAWAIDNQVVMYGYLMEHKIHSRTYTFAGDHGFQHGRVPFDVKMVCETKVRRQASPYGFGLDWGDLSSRQKAIAISLGVSRASK